MASLQRIQTKARLTSAGRSSPVFRALFIKLLQSPAGEHAGTSQHKAEILGNLAFGGEVSTRALQPCSPSPWLHSDMHRRGMRPTTTWMDGAGSSASLHRLGPLTPAEKSVQTPCDQNARVSWRREHIAPAVCTGRASGPGPLPTRLVTACLQMLCLFCLL